MTKRTFLKLALFFISIFLISLLLRKIFGLSLKNLEELVVSFGPLAPAIYSLLLFLGLSIPMNPISDYLLVNLAAYLFPAQVAIVATFFAHSLALSVNYLVARNLAGKILERFTSSKETSQILKLGKKISLAQIFWMRWVLPLTAVGIDIISYAAGVARLPFLKFYFVSIIPWTTINIIFFSATGYLKEREAILFFLPGTTLVVLTTTLAYFIRKS